MSARIAPAPPESTQEKTPVDLEPKVKSQSADELTKVDPKPKADAAADVQIVDEHWGYISDGSKVCEMAKSCPCGNDFMHDSLFCRNCGARRTAKSTVSSANTTGTTSRALVITPEEIERRISERTDAAVKTQVAAATTRLTTEITAAVTKEVGAKLLAEWKGKVDVELERAEALAARLKFATADLKAAEEKQAALEAEMAAKVASVNAENAAMEAKLKKLEAEVTSESHVHIELEKERNALKSRVTSLEAQLAEQTQRAERAEAERAASDAAGASAAAEHAREMAVLKSEFEALLAEVARSEAANAEKDKHIEATAIKAKKEKSVTYLTQFMQARLRRAVAGRFAKWKLQIVDNQIEEQKTRFERLHVLETNHLIKEHNLQLQNVRDAATQQRLAFEATIRQLEQDAESTAATLVQAAVRPNASNPAFNRATALKRCTFGV